MAFDRDARDLARSLLDLPRALRAAGVRADPARARAFLTAVAELGVGRPNAIYWAGRITLCSGPEDLERYDACFARHVEAGLPGPPTGGEGSQTFRAPVWHPAPRRERGACDAPEHAVAACDTEVLRSRDIATLAPAERAEVARLLSLVERRGPRRRSRRTVPARRGRPDLARTVRAMPRRGGEALHLVRGARRLRPRRVVVLIDVSGSMRPYADALLRLAHAVLRGHPGHTEVFAVGTRLTRLTPGLAARDPAAALAAAGRAIPDWGGGTRLGAELKEFLDRFGRRGMARGAVVVIASDGWERGDANELGVQMGRLARLAHRVVWANPHRGRPGYEPLTAGMRAALPHVDDFVPGHSLDALERLTAVIIGGTVRRGATRA
ncbi:vWA domain-containing protein [Marinactinospora thermotolerans]|uniref:VWFA domain-containing protein n=1 Tax=Marinactinospora thermotolerans DSM 45154 TaxID=1122192 RepID=A0A1T4KXP2_9ACTN|nr:VWA domain-containing protein [Marinactinospora thermotolerans]SJZ47214.1 hypothetical protein SAMN02745673_00596 [Marinactinospora thermotolerans DSM 45154]